MITASTTAFKIVITPNDVYLDHALDILGNVVGFSLWALVFLALFFRLFCKNEKW